jgi:hypothetical protein
MIRGLKPDCDCPECGMIRSLPTPNEIAVALEKIQARWSPRQRKCRVADDETRRMARDQSMASLIELDKTVDGLWGGSDDAPSA